MAIYGCPVILLQVWLAYLGNGDNSLWLHDVGKKLHHFRLRIFFVWLLGCYGAGVAVRG